MGYLCKMVIASKDLKLVDKNADTLVAAGIIDRKTLGSLKTVGPSEFYTHKWYCYTPQFLTEYDLGYCQSNKLGMALEKCAIDMIENGIVYLNFVDPEDETILSYAYTSPYGVSGGKGGIPDDWGCTFETDDEVSMDLINLLEELCPGCYDEDFSDETYYKKIELDPEFKARLHAMYN